MTLHVEVDVNDGHEAAHVLLQLSRLIREREQGEGDAIERKVLRSGIYELGLSELKSIDIL